MTINIPPPPKRTVDEAGAAESSSSRNSKASKFQGDTAAGQDAPAEQQSSSKEIDGGENDQEVYNYFRNHVFS